MRKRDLPGVARGRLAAQVGLWLGALGVLHAREPRPPDVLIIYADQFRFDCLGSMGHPDIRTPHLDSLARDGVLYTNSFCVWPVCTPSRYSLLTGLYVRRHRARSNRSTLPPGTATFASILRAGGYSTAAVGKMHFTPAYLDVGFSRMTLAEQNGRGRNVDDYHRYLKQRGLINAIDLIDQERPFRDRASPEYWETFGARVSDLPDEHHITTWVGERAASAIAEWDSERANLLMVGFLKPHHPFDPPAPWHEMYDPEQLSVLPGWTEEVPERDYERAHGYFDNATLSLPALRRVMAYYYATISHMDRQIGSLIEALKTKGLYESTLIVFTADHGEYLGFHHMLLKGNHMYDPLITVPLIVKYPGGRFAGRVSEDLVHSLDVTSTILLEAGLEPAPDMRGERLGGDRPGPARPRRFVIAEDGGHLMIRSMNRKLIQSRGRRRSFYYDLTDDPLELKDRFEDEIYAAEIAEMTQALLRWLATPERGRAYVDLEAPQIDRPNVPRDGVQTELEMDEYFRRRVTPLLNPN